LTQHNTSALRAIYYLLSISQFCFQLHNVSHRKAFLVPLKTSMTINLIFTTYQSFVYKNAHSTLFYSCTPILSFYMQSIYETMHRIVKLLCAYFLQDRKDALLQQSRSWLISLVTDGNTEVLRFEWILVLFYVYYFYF